MLSLNDIGDSLPIARIEGGKNNGKTLYLYDQNKIDEEKQKKIKPLVDYDDIYNLVNSNKKNNRISVLSREKIKKSLEDEDDEIEENLKKDYEDIKNKLLKKASKEIHLVDGKFEPYPNVDLNRAVYFLAGASGSGKTYFCSMMIKHYRKLNPKIPIYIFSRIEEDEVLDVFNPVRIIINEELLEDPIDPIKELHDSICVFDDIDTITDKKLCKYVQLLRDQCLQEGRHANITVFCMSHILLNYKLTTMCIHESHYVVVYRGTGQNHITSYMKNKLGWQSDIIKKICKSNSRWMMIYKNFPQYVITEHDAYVIE